MFLINLKYVTVTWLFKMTKCRHEIVIYTSSQGPNERWQLMSKLVQFTGAHFPDLNSNSYDNLSNIKLDLNISTQVKFSANKQYL